MNVNDNTHRILNRDDAAGYLGISPTALDRLTRKGCISYIEMPSSGQGGRPSRKWTIRDLNEFIDSRRRRSEPPAPPSAGRKRARRAPLPQYDSAADVLASLEGVER